MAASSPFRGACCVNCLCVLVQSCQNRPAEFARCPRCPPGACQRRLLPLPVLVMLIFRCFLGQAGDFYFFTALANKPPLKGVTPHGVGRCPQGRGDRSVRGGPAKLVEGFWCNLFLELQISRQNPSVSLRLPASFSREPNL